MFRITAVSAKVWYSAPKGTDVFHPTRHLRRVVALAGSGLLVTAALATVAVHPAAAAATTTVKPAAATATVKHSATVKHAAAATATGGSGASLPYVEVLAQSSTTNRTVHRA